MILVGTLAACGGEMVPTISEMVPPATEVSILIGGCLPLLDERGELLFEDEHVVELSQPQNPPPTEAEFEVKSLPIARGGALVHQLCTVAPTGTGVELPTMNEPHRIVVEIDSAAVSLDVWVLTDEDWSISAELPTASMLQPARVQIRTGGLMIDENIVTALQFIDVRHPKAIPAEFLQLEDTQVRATRSGLVVLRISASLMTEGTTARRRAPRTVYVLGTRTKCPTYRALLQFNGRITTATADEWAPFRITDARWKLFEHSDLYADLDDPDWRPKALIGTPNGDPPLSFTLDTARSEYSGRNLRLVLQPEFDAEYQAALDDSEPDIICPLQPSWVFRIE